MENNQKKDIELRIDDDTKRMARLLMLTRAESGVSQEKVAMELGVSRKTVQNWERGISMPSIIQTIEWFRIMDVAAIPYLIQFLIPDIEEPSGDQKDEQLRNKLISIVESMPMEAVRQLMYLFQGEHGSSPRAVVNFMVASLNMPLKDRHLIDTMILGGYRLVKEMGIEDKVGVQPVLKVMEEAIEKERAALVKNRENYMMY